MRRRSFLKGSGAMLLIAASGGVWYACREREADRGTPKALEPWENWRGTEEEGALSLVRAGILAASPMNTQPWIFRVTPERIEVFTDHTRTLRATDPFLRQQHMAIGCAVENMVTAASANGFRAEVILPPPEEGGARGEPGPVARLDLERIRPDLPIFHKLIPERHTNRGPYFPDRRIPPDFMLTLKIYLEKEPDLDVAFFPDEPVRGRIAGVILETAKALLAEEEVQAELARWSRRGIEDADATGDGLTRDTSGLPEDDASRAGTGEAPDPAALADRTLRALAEVQLPTTSAFGIIVARNPYDRANAVQAGRIWQYFHLWMTSVDIGAQPLSQPIAFQDRERARKRTGELPEDLRRALPPGPWHTMLPFRIGYPRTVAGPSPRRPLEDVIKKGNRT